MGRVRTVYAPDPDGDPDPGEIVWTWVPYEESDGRGKDRPVLIVAREDQGTLLGVQLTSRERDGQAEWLPLGAGPWDRSGRDSWVGTGACSACIRTGCGGRRARSTGRGSTGSCTGSSRSTAGVDRPPVAVVPLSDLHNRCEEEAVVTGLSERERTHVRVPNMVTPYMCSSSDGPVVRQVSGGDDNAQCRGIAGERFHLRAGDACSRVRHGHVGQCGRDQMCHAGTDTEHRERAGWLLLGAVAVGHRHLHDALRRHDGLQRGRRRDRLRHATTYGTLVLAVLVAPPRSPSWGTGGTWPPCSAAA